MGTGKGEALQSETGTTTLLTTQVTTQMINVLMVHKVRT